MTDRKGLPWTDDEEAYLRARYLLDPMVAISAALGRPKSAVYKAARRLGLSKAGTRIDAPGTRPPNYQPVGATLTGNRGQRYVKVREGAWPRAWRLVHHVMWEQAHGAIPPGHVLTFRDGNHTNVDLANLELVAKTDWIKRYIPEHRYPPELAQLIRLKGALTRQINQTQEKGEQE